ncbi:unnamed protein product, partial [Hapterophycus canaliculatus]
MVKDHITHNVVRVPAAGGSGRGAYFQQAVGIPQGSVLSGLLCNYFFGHIEKCLLGDVLESSPHLSLPTPAAAVDARRRAAMIPNSAHDGRGRGGGIAAGGRVHGGGIGLGGGVGGSGGGSGGSGDSRQRDGATTGRMAAGKKRPFPDPEGDCTLLRQVDDFLLLLADSSISTNKAKAEAFVRVMHDESKTGAWGFSVHEAKV